MPLSLKDISHFLWTIPIAWAGSFEWRLRDKVGSKQCETNRDGVEKRFNDFQTFVDTRINDLLKYNEKQTRTILRAIRKNGIMGSDL